MVFGFGDSKKTEEKIWKLLSSQILKFEEIGIKHVLSKSDCQTIATEFGYTISFLNTSNDGTVFQWYTFDSPPFVYEFIQSDDYWNMNLIGTKEYNKLQIGYLSRGTTLHKKLEAKNKEIFSVERNGDAYGNNDSTIGEKTNKLALYLLSIEGYYDPYDPNRFKSKL